MPKVSEEHMEARRNQILEAACRCFADKGFHRTTIRDICARAELSAGAVYRYFTSKDEIIKALAELGKQNTRSILDAARCDEGPTRTLANLMTTVIALFDSEEGAESARLDLRMWSEALSTPTIHGLFLEALANAMAPFAQVISDGQHQGEIAASLDADGAARVFVALALGITVLKALQPEVSLAGSSQVVSALVDGRFSIATAEP